MIVDCCLQPSNQRYIIILMTDPIIIKGSCIGSVHWNVMQWLEDRKLQYMSNDHVMPVLVKLIREAKKRINLMLQKWLDSYHRKPIEKLFE